MSETNPDILDDIRVPVVDSVDIERINEEVINPVKPEG